MKKRIISIITMLALCLTSFPMPALAVDSGAPEGVTSNAPLPEDGETQFSEPAKGTPGGNNAGAMQRTKDDNDIAYQVTGGNIYFDTTTATITDCDRSVTVANIPEKINDIVVVNIGGSAFNGCADLTSLTIPDNVANIGDSAFAYCTGLTSLTIPDSVTSIGNYTFEGCSNLIRITISQNITSITRAMFSNCTSLTSLVIPNNVTRIGEFAFSGCTNLTSLTIPNSVIYIDYHAFGGCTGLTSAGPIGGNYGYKFGWTKTIPSNAFNYCSSLTSITIPNSVTTIGSFAFNYCTGLTSLIIPDSVTTIENSAFNSCTGLTSLTIPDNVTTIGDSAFAYCTGLTSLIIPDSVTRIGMNVFEYCTGLTSITLSNSVTDIEDCAFKNCKGLTGITISNNVTTIGDSAFNGCTGLTSLIIPNSVTTIGSHAFEHCTKLTSMTLPNSVTKIGQSAFGYCTSLSSITISNNVTSISRDAFTDCTSLTNLKIPNSVTNISYGAFWCCTNLINIAIPDSVTSIGLHSFNGCNALTDVYYGGSEELWNAISGHSNIPSAAEIHYNCNVDTNSEIKFVDYLRTLDMSKNEAYLGYGVLPTPYKVTGSTSVTGASSLDQLLHKYVLVKTSESDSQEIVSIQPVDSAVTTVLSVNGNQISLGNGKTMPLADYIDPSIVSGYAGEMVLCHTVSGTVVDLTLLPERTGTLEEWDGSNKTLTIDSNVYNTNYVTDLSFVENVDKLLGQQVSFYAPYDSNFMPVFLLSRRTYETKIGVFSHCDPIAQTATIDGKSFPVNYSKCEPDTDALNGKKVFFLLEDGKIVHIDAMDNLKPALDASVHVDGELHYQNGAFDVSQVPCTVTLSYGLGYTFPEHYDRSVIYNDASIVKTLAVTDTVWEMGDRLSIDAPNIQSTSVAPGKKESFTANIKLKNTQKPEYISETIQNTLTVKYAFIEQGAQEREAVCAFDVILKNADSQEPNPDNPGGDDTLSDWDKMFLKELYAVEDVNVTCSNEKFELGQYFEESTIENIGWVLSYWVAARESEMAKQTKGDLPACLKLTHKIEKGNKKGHDAILIFRYNTFLDIGNSDYASMNKVSLTMIDSSVKNGAIIKENELHSFTVTASGKKFADDIKIYLKSKYAESFVKFCKKLGTKALKETIKDIAAMSGEEYLNSMLSILQDIATIAKNAKEFADYAGKASAILKDPLNASVTSVKEFNEITAKYASCKCPVDVYIYNPKGELCGSIVNNKIETETAEVFLDVTGTEKSFWLGSGDYTVKISATDKGTMDYTVKEYDKEGEHRTVSFDDVPLKTGLTYQASVPQALNVKATEYALVSNEGNTVYANTDSNPPTDTPTTDNTTTNGSTTGVSTNTSLTYSITVTKAEHGSVSVNPSKPKKGETVTITVIPDDGYELSALTVKDSSGKEISITKMEDNKNTFIMPAGKVTVTPSFQQKTEQSNEPEQQKGIFVDVPVNAYYADAVAWAVKQGITNGTTSTTFSPENSCTRAQMVTFLWRAEGSPSPKNKDNPFADVTDKAYYYDAVLWAVEQGITTGTSATNFSPEDIVTRGQTVTFLHRAAGTPETSAANPFTDVAANVFYSKAAIWAAEQDITKGTTGTTFSPNDNCTRGQIVTFLYRAA